MMEWDTCMLKVMESWSGEEELYQSKRPTYSSYMFNIFAFLIILGVALVDIAYSCDLIYSFDFFMVQSDLYFILKNLSCLI